MIVAFTGGRTYTEAGPVEAILLALSVAAEWFYYANDGCPLRIRVGDCPTGLDATVRAIAATLGKHTELAVYKADWGKHGKAAGPIRNKEMLTMEMTDRGPLKSEANLLIACEGGAGTADCVRQASELGIRTIKVWP